MSLIDDLDDLMWPITLKFSKTMTTNEYHDFVDWCNLHFGMDGWWHDSKGYMRLRKEEYSTMFMLRWS